MNKKIIFGTICLILVCLNFVAIHRYEEGKPNKVSIQKPMEQRGK